MVNQLSAPRLGSLLGFLCLYSSLLHAQQNESQDWAGIKQDFLYFVAYQTAAIGVISVLPEDVSNWENGKFSVSNWSYNVTHPRWDDPDHWSINYVLHPYWGSAYYVRARERGFSKIQSFWVSAVFSASYELGQEAFFERTSTLDLVVTPVIGSAFGMLIEGTRNKIKAKNELNPTFGRRTILVLTDPLGALNRKVNKWFGADNPEYGIKSTQLSLATFTALGEFDQQQGRRAIDKAYGVQLKIGW